VCLRAAGAIIVCLLQNSLTTVAEQDGLSAVGANNAVPSHTHTAAAAAPIDDDDDDVASPPPATAAAARRGPKIKKKEKNTHARAPNPQTQHQKNGPKSQFGPIK
jgi:hypothetical protein